MSKRLASLPSSLLQQTRFEQLSSARVPALLAHPDWRSPAPAVLWMHGRTVNKELDPGRYLRWIRAGIAACAVDLPGHGERADPSMQRPDATLHVVAQMIEEIDAIVDALREPPYAGLFDLSRIAIGGMSAGGMAALRRLCDPHPFACAAVESTAGDFSKMGYERIFPPDLVARLNPMRHLGAWRAVPLLALHSEADEWVPVEAIRSFTDALRARSPDAAVQLVTWPTTGAPYEHAGFGRVAADAKNAQTSFLTERLLGPSAQPANA